MKNTRSTIHGRPFPGCILRLWRTLRPSISFFAHTRHFFIASSSPLPSSRPSSMSSYLLGSRARSTGFPRLACCFQPYRRPSFVLSSPCPLLTPPSPTLISTRSTILTNSELGINTYSYTSLMSCFVTLTLAYTHIHIYTHTHTRNSTPRSFDRIRLYSDIVL